MLPPPDDQNASRASEPPAPPYEAAPYDADPEALPDDHPAYDRVQDRPESPPRGRKRNVFGLVVLLIAGLFITYLLLRPDGTEGGTPDLLTLAAAQAPSVRLDILTEDLDEAEAFIYDEFGWPVRVPVLPDLRLVGAGVAEIADGVELPVLQYGDETTGPITVYVYDYAFLDAATGRLQLAPAVYARLAEDTPVDVRRVGDVYLVLWRRRATIYTAVTMADPAPFVEYLRRRP